MKPLQPFDGPLFVVRWRNTGRGDTDHKYFRRRTDAERFHQLLVSRGKDTSIFSTTTSWSLVDPKAVRP